MKKWGIPVVGLIALLQAPLLASDGDLLGEDFSIGAEAEVNINHINSRENGNQTQFNDSFISVNATWKDKVRLILTGKLEKIFKDNDVEFTDDFSFDEFLQEAYIEIRDVNGTATAVVIGKQPIPFGQNVQAMPIFGLNPMADLQSIEEVYGITLDFTDGLLDLFTQFEVSVFESEGGDLEIGKIDGLSVRMSQMLNESVQLTGSYARLGNDHIPGAKTEQRVSLGIIFESIDGKLIGWAEGIAFSENPDYPKSELALTIGGMIRATNTTDIIIEYSAIEDQVKQYSIGSRTALTKNISLGLEIRYDNYVEQKNDLSFNANLNYVFDSRQEQTNEDYVFGNDKEE
jgi:hypothetical protein